MDPFELLKKDHKKVSELFAQIEAASGQTKMTIFRQLKNELDVHAHIEESIFYPALEGEPETRDITLEAYEEHKVVKDLLAQLDAATSPDEDWIAKLTVLKENVEHHVEEEEGELFDKANDVLTGDQADQLGNEMQAEKERQLPASTSVKPTKTRAAAKPKQATKKPGLLKTLANALGIGGSKRTATKTTKGTKAAKASKATKASKSARKTAGKPAKKAPAKAAKKSTKRAPAKKSPAKSTKRKAPVKSGRKATRKTSKRR
jgi:hypothetical protein